ARPARVAAAGSADPLSRLRRVRWCAAARRAGRPDYLSWQFDSLGHSECDPEGGRVGGGWLDRTHRSRTGEFHVSISRPIAIMAGIGAAAPEGRLTNADLERNLDTSDEWIVERTGIRERRIAASDETLTSYAVRAARQAMEQAGVTADDLDGIVVATVTADRRLPSEACDLQAALGARRAWAFDVVAACPGWVYAVTVAEGLMATGQGDT